MSAKCELSLDFVGLLQNAIAIFTFCRFCQSHYKPLCRAASQRAKLFSVEIAFNPSSCFNVFFIFLDSLSDVFGINYKINKNIFALIAMNFQNTAVLFQYYFL